MHFEAKLWFFSFILDESLLSEVLLIILIMLFKYSCVWNNRTCTLIYFEGLFHPVRFETNIKTDKLKTFGTNSL